MKKKISFRLLLISVLVLSITACTKSVKTEYTNVLPANATEVAAVDVKSIIVKSGLSSAEGQQSLQKVLHLLLENGSAALSKQMEALMKDPSETGIDWSAPIYMFNAPSLHSAALAIKVTDLEKLETLFEALVKANICTALTEESNGYCTTEVRDAGVLLAFNDGTLLAVYGSSSAQLKKLNSAIAVLMTQPSDKSIHANANFKLLEQQKGDIRVLATPDALPFEVRGILKWPHGTQLIGNIVFENGRIYAMLQRAGFTGKTQESNQPFHPKNSRELQQAMLMTQGTPFNIELTSEELLTLTNVRVLMEYASEEPEIQTFYQLIMKVESLNLRGDSNRTQFTLTLNDKSQNSLQQIIEFARQFAGF